MATTQLQLRRGTDVETAAFTGAEGELTYDTTTKTLRIHDGFTEGGILIDKSSNLMHLAGTETITGDKTFAGTTTLGKQDNNIEGGQINFQKADNDPTIDDHVSLDLYNGNIRFVASVNNNYVIPMQLDFANNKIIGTATTAEWADLAENYESDEKYPVGTLISFSGKKDITIAKVNCNGVISDKPGYLLDSNLENSQPVALVGKTPIRVIGKIQKFDRIVLSDIPGVGKEQTTSDEKVIAIALESNESVEEKLVKCVTKFNLD